MRLSSSQGTANKGQSRPLCCNLKTEQCLFAGTAVVGSPLPEDSDLEHQRVDVSLTRPPCANPCGFCAVVVYLLQVVSILRFTYFPAPITRLGILPPCILVLLRQHTTD